jgi:hypothetical protein
MNRKRRRTSGPHHNFMNTRFPHPGEQKRARLVPAPGAIDWIGQIDGEPRIITHMTASTTGFAALRSAARIQTARDGAPHRAACSAATVVVRRGTRRACLAAVCRIGYVPDAATSNGGPQK